MDKVILANKKIGETPLDVIRKLKTTNSALSTKKMAYAGRLDPMAEGLLLILIGDECRNRTKYQNLDKKYEFEVLFGIKTDTYDILGKITNTSSIKVKNLNTKLESIIQTFVGTFRQKYPPYSATHVNGKPLYYWARRGKLDSIKIPSKEIKVYSLKLLKIKPVTKFRLEKKLLGRLDKVHGDLRQEEIKKTWKNYFIKNDVKKYQVAKFEISCSSGTYVRSIANEIGTKLKVPSLAYSINRISVGNYSLSLISKS